MISRRSCGAEVRLAKAEIAQELVKVKVAAVWLVAGALGAMFGLWFGLFAAFYALTAVMPEWAAALTLAIALLLVALVTLRLGIGPHHTATTDSRTNR